MNEAEIKELLDKLADFQAQKEVVLMDKQAVIDSVLTPEIKAKIADIEAEFSDKTAGVSENISKMEAEVKQAVLDNGSSVKGNALQAVFAKGRVSSCCSWRDEEKE